MIGIIDYNRGNMKSVEKALNKMDLKCIFSQSKDELRRCSHLILPGVGAFRDCMNELIKLDLVEFIKKEVASGKPFLGICVGFQLMFEYGYEDGKNKGLGIFKGVVSKIETKEKIPHIGWNTCEIKRDSKILKNIDNNEPFYFVHSYSAKGVSSKDVVAVASYDEEIVACIENNNVCGLQFHPEKSSLMGLKILENFGRNF